MGRRQRAPTKFPKDLLLVNTQNISKKDWIVGEGDPGPDPGDIACENEIEVEHQCLDMLNADWLREKCSLFVDFEEYLETCKVDYCIEQNEEQLYNN